MAHYQRRLVERDFFLNTRLDDFLNLRDDFGVRLRRRREPPFCSSSVLVVYPV